ncbi:hypothetical protein Y032_0053g2415 [Ancylostoma ceylanicum]|uniref:Uncharacterized protein n=1 Tax=Ancylostoma ceylanicum TaxID=53326 RepID=A0A016U8R7_9BILA|nr:hypothetical protein Y032_0053g2415 [Ancylostoma ceylanicum]
MASISLGSTVSSDCSLTHEITTRTNASWIKWITPAGVLCDRDIPDHLKGNVRISRCRRNPILLDALVPMVYLKSEKTVENYYL